MSHLDEIKPQLQGHYPSYISLPDDQEPQQDYTPHLGAQSPHPRSITPVSAQARQGEHGLPVEGRNLHQSNVALFNETHLPPIRLKRVKPSSRRFKAGWIFLVACFGSVIFPITATIIYIVYMKSVENDSLVLTCWMEHKISIWKSWVGFGTFSFAQAKAIDVMFNLVVGSGGQLLMGYLTFKSHISGLGQVMEISPVSYELFTTMVFTGTSGTTLLALYRRVLATRDFRLKMIWFLFSTGYVLSFGNIIGAMTRYRSNTEPVVIIQGGGLVTLEQFVSESLVYLADNGQSEGSRIKIVEWMTLPSTDYFNSTFFTVNGTTYDTQYLINSCLDRGKNPTYNYGFTGWILLLVCNLQCMWCFGTYFVWVRGNSKSMLKQARRDVGTYRAIIDLGEALAEDLGTNISGYSNNQLEQILLSRKLGLRYYQSSGEPRHIGITSRDIDDSDRVNIAREDHDKVYT